VFIFISGSLCHSLSVHFCWNILSFISMSCASVIFLEHFEWMFLHLVVFSPSLSSPSSLRAYTCNLFWMGRVPLHFLCLHWLRTRSTGSCLPSSSDLVWLGPGTSVLWTYWPSPLLHLFVDDVDINNFMPIILCSSCHHFDMNLGSLSLTIKDGNLCIHTIFCTYIVDSWDAVIFVFTGMRCTIEVILQMTTHR